MKVHDRVRDRFKIPRAEDHCVTGTVVRMDGATRSIAIEMDDGEKRTLSLANVDALFEVIEDDVQEKPWKT